MNNSYLNSIQEEGNTMITPDMHDPNQVMNILLVEVRALSEAFKEFKEERRELFKDHIGDCKKDMNLVFDRLRKVEEKSAKQCAVKEHELKMMSVEPHWAIAKASWLIGGATCLLLIEVFMNVYRFWRGLH